MVKAELLLVEDDIEISRLTRLYLEAEDYHVTVIEDGAEADAAIREHNPDLVILDLMLPNVSGHEICQQARFHYTQPILVLTACDDDINEVSLLKLGADDYLSKPVRPHILVARIEALLRRFQRSETPSLSSKQLQLNANSRSASLGDTLLELTEAEFEMLSLLYQHKGSPVSRDQCCQALRGIDYDFGDRSIDMRISGLRKKLGDNQRPYETIVTVRNKGYQLNVSD